MSSIWLPCLICTLSRQHVQLHEDFPYLIIVLAALSRVVPSCCLPVVLEGPGGGWACCLPQMALSKETQPDSEPTPQHRGRDGSGFVALTGASLLKQGAFLQTKGLSAEETRQSHRAPGETSSPSQSGHGLWGTLPYTANALE